MNYLSNVVKDGSGRVVAWNQGTLQYRVVRDSQDRLSQVVQYPKDPFNGVMHFNYRADGSLVTIKDLGLVDPIVANLLKEDALNKFQPLLTKNNVSWFNPPGNSTTVNQLGMVVTGTGTATAANVTSANIHQAARRLEYAVTTAATTAVAGLRSGVAQQFIGDTETPFGGFHFVTRFGPSRGVAANTTRRFFVGMTSVTSAPTDVEPSTWAANGIGVAADLGDVNFQILHRSGTGVATKIDTGIPKAALDASELFEVAIYTIPTDTPSVTVRLTRLSDGVSFTHTITTKLPSASQLLTWQMWISVGGTSSVVGLSVASVLLVSDY